METVIVCGAKHNLSIINQYSSDGPMDLIISSVDGISPGRLYLGVGSPNDVKEQIERCNRCTGKPERRCDLQWTMFSYRYNKLEPQG